MSIEPDKRLVFPACDELFGVDAYISSRPAIRCIDRDGNIARYDVEHVNVKARLASGQLVRCDN